MVYLLKMVIFHGKLLNNQRVKPINNYHLRYCWNPIHKMVSHWDRHWVYDAGILGLVHERPKDDAAHASTVRKWSHGNIGPHWISSGYGSKLGTPIIGWLILN
jgi:hypothetical protein